MGSVIGESKDEGLDAMNVHHTALALLEAINDTVGILHRRGQDPKIFTAPTRTIPLGFVACAVGNDIPLLDIARPNGLPPGRSSLFKD